MMLRRHWPALLPLLGAIALWPTQIDDQFISLAYSRSLAWYGNLDWGAAVGWGGERVEGYSNLLWVVLMALPIKAGLDPDKVARLLALACGVGATMLVTRRAGVWVGAALGLWVPMAWWSTAGMETTLYAVLLGFGWVEIVEKRSGWGLGLLLLAAWCRPEGAAHFLAALALTAREQPRLSSAFAAGFLGYHVLRAAYFGAWVPTPFLVKVQENAIEVDALFQWLQELLTLLGIGLALRWTRTRPSPLMAVPFAIQTLVELVSDTDWMGHGRLLLPGVVGSIAIGAVTSGPRELTGWRRYGLAGVIGMASLLDPPGIGKPFTGLRSYDLYLHPLYALALPLDTPALEDVRWIVRNVPDGATVFTGDVGMVGNIPGVRVVDLNGLTNRELASFNLGKTELPGRPAGDCYVRQTIRSDGSGLGLEGWMGENLWESGAWVLDDVRVRWLWCGEGRAPEVASDVVLKRLETMISWFPSQGALQRLLVEERIRAGQRQEAIELVHEIVGRWPWDLRGRELRRRVSFSGGPSQFTSVDLTNLSVILGIKVEKPGTVRLRWDCGEWEAITVEKTLEIPLIGNTCGGKKLLIHAPPILGVEPYLMSVSR